MLAIYNIFVVKYSYYLWYSYTMQHLIKYSHTVTADEIVDAFSKKIHITIKIFVSAHSYASQLSFTLQKVISLLHSNNDAYSNASLQTEPWQSCFPFAYQFSKRKDKLTSTNGKRICCYHFFD